MQLEMQVKTAQVTGAGQGVDLAFTMELNRLGAAGTANDFRAECAEAMTRELAADGIRAIALEGSVTELEQLDRSKVIMQGMIKRKMLAD